MYSGSPPVHTQLSFCVSWCPSIWQFSKNPHFLFEKNNAFSNVGFWTTRNHFFCFLGRVKGAGKVALNPHFFLCFFGLSFLFSSLFLFVSSLLFFFMKRTTSNYSITMFSLINPFFLFCFPVFSSLSKPLSLSLLFA